MPTPSHSTIKFLTWSPVVFIPAIVVMVLLLILSSYDQHYEDTLSSLESDLIATEQQALKAKVDGVVEWVDYQQSIIEDNLTNRVKDRVETAHKIALATIEQYQGSNSPEEVQKLITTTLRPLVWNNGESFIWMLDYDGIFKLAPSYLRHLEGSSIINFQDATGRYVIQEEIEICKTEEAGFLWDTFTKPDDPSGKQYRQVAYVKALGHYNWYLGSGEYLDTALSKTNEELLNSIEKIGSKQNYMFVLNAKGQGLLNPSLSLDRNQLDSDDDRVQKVIQQHLENLQTQSSGFINYDWINPQTELIEKKYSYARKTATKDWLIGSGFYASEIRAKADQKAGNIHADYRNKLQTFLILSITWVVVAFLIGYWLTRYISNYFDQYQRAIHHKTDELETLNAELENKVLERTSELEASRQAYEALAKTDSLTGTANRYAIMHSLEKEINRALRNQAALTVMMFDIDFFKPINDQYGHDMGDEVLRKITHAVKQALRDIDVLGRYGGDEFLIILPDTNLDNALILAERIRITVERLDFKAINQVTISAGLVEYQTNESAIELFKRLDQKLYEAKNNRNHIAS